MNHLRLTTAMLAASLALPAATIGSSEPVAWRLAHPEAQILAGVDFRRLAETPDGVQLQEQFRAALGPAMLENAERLLLSSVVESNGDRADLLILSGSFSLANLRKLAMKEGARMVPFKGLEIAAPPGAKPGEPHLAWTAGPVGVTTVLIGTRPAIQAAADRSRANVGALSAVNPLFGRARDLAAEHPVWVACETVPQGIGPKALDEFFDDGKATVDGQLQGFDLAVGLGKSSSLQLWLRTTSEAAATTAFHQFQAAAMAKESFVLSSWLPEMKGTIDSSTLLLETGIQSGTVARRVGPLLAAFALPVDWKQAQIAPPPVGPVLPPALPPPAQPVSARPMFVRIQGLDDGVKEIPYSSRP